jgi:hypothetical protein
MRWGACILVFGVLGVGIVAWYWRGRPNSAARELVTMKFELNYNDTVFLDAETLAEGGIKDAYTALLQRLRQYTPKPQEVYEDLDRDAERYAVRWGTKEVVIYAPNLSWEKGESWGRATFAFFSLVNDQLRASEYKFYAINDGNDLGGMFLTPAQALAARKTLPNQSDWPYLPTAEEPWFGQFH